MGSQTRLGHRAQRAFRPARPPKVRPTTHCSRRPEASLRRFLAQPDATPAHPRSTSGGQTCRTSIKVWPVWPNLVGSRRSRRTDGTLVGPPGFEPGTKGFACSGVSPGADYLFTLSLRWWGAGRSSLSSRTLQSPGSLCTFRWCTTGLAHGCRRPDRCGSPEFIPFFHRSFRTGVTFR